MLEEEEKEMNTKNKINSLINDIQNKLNKRVSNNYDFRNIYNQGFQSKQNNNYLKNTVPLNNNFMKQGPNYPYQQSDFNSVNEYAFRNMIKEEFSSLILPYQKDLILNKTMIDNKLDDIEKKFEIIINAQNMGNLNDNAKIISSYLSSNLSNENSKKNFEKLKIENESKFNEFEKRISSILEQIQEINEENNKNEKNLEDIKKFLEKKEENEKKKEKENREKEKSKEMKIYLEKNIFDSELNKINQRFMETNNNHKGSIQKLNEQIDNMSKLINQFKLEINKINGLDNNINSIRGEFGKITEDISSLKYQVTPDIINKINSIDFNKLKQQIPLIEFNKLKNDITNFDNNFYSVKNITENNERNISEIKTNLNDIEQKQNLMNKNIEENISNKIKEINNKIEEINKKEKEKEKEEKKEELKTSKINNVDNNEDKKEGEPDLFIGSSRRQQRNSKSVNQIENKNQNINLDEKSLNMIKQLEKINLDELQKMNFNALLNQIGDLSRENKILTDKIEQQNKTIAEINERINKLNTDINNNALKANNVYQRDIKTSNNTNNNNIINKEKTKKDSFIEDDYDDFDKDINSDIKNEVKNETVKEKVNATPNNDLNNNKNNLIEDANYRNDILKKSKNEFGSFSKYSEVNILDQIMGVNDREKKPVFGVEFPEPKFGGGSTFITGSLNENNNNNKFNVNEKPTIFEDDKNKNENNKSKDLKNESNKERKEEENFDENFDDFSVDEI